MLKEHVYGIRRAKPRPLSGYLDPFPLVGCFQAGLHTCPCSRTQRAAEGVFKVRSDIVVEMFINSRKGTVEVKAVIV